MLRQFHHRRALSCKIEHKGDEGEDHHEAENVVIPLDLHCFCFVHNTFVCFVHDKRRYSGALVRSRNGAAKVWRMYYIIVANVFQ